MTSTLSDGAVPRSAGPAPGEGREVTVAYETLIGETAAFFVRLGLPEGRARLAAEALCYGDLTGMDSHGVFNLARLYRPLPEGWLADATGRPVTDPAELDRGGAYLQWLGGRPETGSYKGYGLSLMVEVLAALLPGAGLGPDAEALAGDGRPAGRDDDIGFLVLALAPAALRPAGEVDRDAAGLFGALLDCPPVRPDAPVRYPGWPEAEHAERALRGGVPLAAGLHAELVEVATELGLPAPDGRPA